MPHAVAIVWHIIHLLLYQIKRFVNGTINLLYPTHIPSVEQILPHVTDHTQSVIHNTFPFVKNKYRWTAESTVFIVRYLIAIYHILSIAPHLIVGLKYGNEEESYAYYHCHAAYRPIPYYVWNFIFILTNFFVNPND